MCLISRSYPRLSAYSSDDSCRRPARAWGCCYETSPTSASDSSWPSSSNGSSPSSSAPSSPSSPSPGCSRCDSSPARRWEIRRGWNRRGRSVPIPRFHLFLDSYVRTRFKHMSRFRGIDFVIVLSQQHSV